MLKNEQSENLTGSTIKNDLGVDCISRKAVEDITWQEPSYTDALNVLTEVRDKVRELPSVYPKNNKLSDGYYKREYLRDLGKEIYHELCKEVHGKEDCPCTNQTTSCLAKFRVCDADRAIGRVIDRKIAELPSVYPKSEKPSGDWIERQEPLGEDDVDIFYMCTNCHETFDYPTNYCPNCGADMRGEE